MRKGFTLVELLVVMAIVSLLAAMLLPALARTRLEARKTAWRLNIGEVGKALQMYLNENAGEWPSVPNDSSETLSLLYDEYLDDLGVLACPATARGAPFIDDYVLPGPSDDYLAGYTWVNLNPALEDPDDFDDPGEREQLDYMIDTNLNGRQTMSMWSSTFAIMCDAAGEPVNGPRPYQALWNHGSDGVNVLLAGGSARWMRTVETVDVNSNNILVVPNPHSENGNYDPAVDDPEDLYGDHNIYDHIGDGMSTYIPTDLDATREWGDGWP